jgi:hypothetical protein
LEGKSGEIARECSTGLHAIAECQMSALSPASGEEEDQAETWDKLHVYRSKLRGTVGKPDHTAGRREVSGGNITGRSSTRNGVWMVKTGRAALLPGAQSNYEIALRSAPSQSAGKPLISAHARRKRDLQRL